MAYRTSASGQCEHLSESRKEDIARHSHNQVELIKQWTFGETRQSFLVQALTSADAGAQTVDLFISKQRLHDRPTARTGKGNGDGDGNRHPVLANERGARKYKWRTGRIPIIIARDFELASEIAETMDAGQCASPIQCLSWGAAS